MSSLISLIRQTVPVRHSLREWFSPSTWGQDSYDSATCSLGSYRENYNLCTRLPKLKEWIKTGCLAGQFWQILSPSYNHHNVLYSPAGQGPCTWDTHDDKCLSSLPQGKASNMPKHTAWFPRNPISIIASRISGSLRFSESNTRLGWAWLFCVGHALLSH